MFRFKEKRSQKIPQNIYKTVQPQPGPLEWAACHRKLERSKVGRLAQDPRGDRDNLVFKSDNCDSLLTQGLFLIKVSTPETEKIRLARKEKTGKY
jgi:hypothetical protein